VADDREAQFASDDRNQAHIRSDAHADRRSGDVADIDERADRVLLFEKVGLQPVDTGPFDQGHHERGGEHRRHAGEPRKSG